MLKIKNFNIKCNNNVRPSNLKMTMTSDVVGAKVAVQTDPRTKLSIAMGA